MSLFKKILVPLDFSDSSRAAQQRAEELARATGAELLLLHAIDDTPLLLVDAAAYIPAEAFEQYQTAAKQSLDACVQEAQKSGVAVSAQLMRGRPDQTILEAAKKAGADLIVMGTHGRSGVRHLLLGSVAERVVRTSPLPVMTVRAPATKP